MTRVTPVRRGQGGPLVRTVLAVARRKLGRETDPPAVIARRPGLLAGYAALELAVERAAVLPPRLRALAVLKSAAVQRCEFCCDIGSWEARRAGVSTEELLALPRHRESPLFDARDRAALDLAVAMTRTPPEPDDALLARLRKHLSEPEIVELAFLVGVENLRSRVNIALGAEPAGFSDGQVCAVPETLPA